MADKIIKIMQEPKGFPCDNCKNCDVADINECAKIEIYNSKIIAKEYDRQEAIDRMSMAWCDKEFKNNASAEDIDYCDRIAETMLDALLGVK